MFPKAKVIQLGQIAKDLRKKVVEIEAQLKLDTPPEVIEERRKTTTYAAKRIEEVESSYAKAVNQVSQTWEALIDNTKLKKFAKEMRITEIGVTQLKNEMKKLPLA